MMNLIRIESIPPLEEIKKKTIKYELNLYKMEFEAYSCNGSAEKAIKYWEKFTF